MMVWSLKVELHRDYVDAARSVGASLRAMLMFQEMASNTDQADPDQGCEDLESMIHRASSTGFEVKDRENGFTYRSYMMAWLHFDTGKDRLDMLLPVAIKTEGLEDGDLERRSNVLHTAYEASRSKCEDLKKMEIIKQIAVINGASFEDILGDDDLSKSFAYCEPHVPHMTPFETEQYMEALAGRQEDSTPEMDI
jgi:hypothetical protein